ncbi:MAG: polysaccharide export protein [Acidobacteria bacterium]|nr:polysaccharide export protein [Acidobacteriota bacterium]
MSKQKTAPILDLSTMALLLIAVGLLFGVQAAAQSPSTSPSKATVTQGDNAKAERKAESPPGGYQDQSFRDIIRQFSETYRLGPGDSLALRVKGQPDYSLEKVKVSPLGNIYHPLLGDIAVAGLTLEQLKKQLATDLSEYVLDPVVSLELLEAMSAKVGVIGEVKTPRIIVMAGPMTVLDAINEAGGFTDFSSKSNVTLLRQTADGSRVPFKVNVKNILGGKAGPEENIALQAGDTVIVSGNAMKVVVPVLSTLTSLTTLLTFISFGAR